MAQTSRQTLGIQLCKSGTKKRIGLAFVLGVLLFLDGDGWLGFRTTQHPPSWLAPPWMRTSTWIPYLPCHRGADRFMPKVLPGSPYVRRTCRSTKEKGGGQLVRPLTAPILTSRVCRNRLVPPSGLSMKRPPRWIRYLTERQLRRNGDVLVVARYRCIGNTWLRHVAKGASFICPKSNIVSTRNTYSSSYASALIPNALAARRQVFLGFYSALPTRCCSLFTTTPYLYG
ncbi:hypothetical protein J3F84DRAFT_266499 [Trichoderma pleuroticola]